MCKREMTHRHEISSQDTVSSADGADFAEVPQTARLRHNGDEPISPPDLPGACIIEPAIVYQAVGASPAPTRPHLYKIRKVLAFICIEGPFRTFRKGRESLLALKSESEETLVIVAGKLRGTDQWCAACGRQYSARLAEMLFRKELVFPALDEEDATSLAQELGRMLKRNADLCAKLLDFNQYSQERPPVVEVGRPCAEDDWCEKACSANFAAPCIRAGGQDGQPRPLIQVGAGSYPCMYTLRYMRGHTFHALIEYNPVRAASVGKRFGFEFVETDYKRVLDRAADLVCPTVIVASYDSTHTGITIDFLKANPRARVLIEKPPAISYEQFERLLPYMRNSTYFIDVGYNRRYTRMVWRATRLLRRHEGPITITCIIREDDMTHAHWNFWKSEGTRIHANLCHWIDLGVLLTSQRPVEIVCLAGRDFQFSSGVSIRFEDDSVVNLISGTNGNGLRGVQEYIDIRRGYLTIKIDDFMRMTVLDDGQKRVYRAWPRDKGHAEMYRSFSRACATGCGTKYSLTDFVRSCVLTEEICEMFRTGQRHRRIDLPRLGAWEASSES